jgi:hypothetical protein
MAACAPTLEHHFQLGADPEMDQGLLQILEARKIPHWRDTDGWLIVTFPSTNERDATKQEIANLRRQIAKARSTSGSPK